MSLRATLPTGRTPPASPSPPARACRSPPSEEAEIVAFRSANDLREHVALIIGKQIGDRAPLVRLHSECLTGDILGSLKCDCGPQLDAALAAMADEASEAAGACCSICARKGAASA